MQIIIDGDSCPVIDLTMDIARMNKIPVTIVKSINHVISSDYAKVISVDPIKESADFYIVNKVSEGDIVISQDYGLAAMIIPKNVKVITPRGLLIDDSNIDTLLHHRYIAAKMRKQKRSFGSKSKKRTRTDNIKFVNSLKSVLKDISEYIS